MAQQRSGSWIFPAVCLATAVGAVQAQRAANPLGVWVFVVVLGGWIITLCLHEFAHAALALAGGDHSVRARGYLTLNPLRYTDAANSLIIPVLLLAIGGIPLPGGAVLGEPGRLRHRWWSSVVSAGGPATNMAAGAVLAVVAAPFDSALGAALSFLALLQFVAGILNLLPVPGFDGYGIIAPYLSRRFTAAIAPYRMWLPLIAFAIIWFIPGVSRLLFDGGFWLLDAVGGNELAAQVGSELFRFWR
jgi:Zn-dependent protease